MIKKNTMLTDNISTSKITTLTVKTIRARIQIAMIMSTIKKSKVIWGNSISLNLSYLITKEFSSQFGN
jgi:hypothetical protein